MSRPPLTSVRAAFLDAIREAPDDDAPRLIYADWLDDHGGPADVARAALIRVQCRLASLPPDDPARAPLVEQEGALINTHQADWVDLAFADWLAHPKRRCHNPLGHEFCKIVAQGIRARCERDRLPKSDPRRQKMEAKLERLGERMEDEFDYSASTCDSPPYADCVFARGFVERADIPAYAAYLFTEALPALEVLRDVSIEDESGVEFGDKVLNRLVTVTGRMRLRDLDLAEAINEPDTPERFASSPGVRSLERLSLWVGHGDTGDAAVQAFAGSPHLAGLRDMEIEHTRTFTDEAFLAVLDSPHLAGLERCTLTPNEAMTLSEPVRRRFEARFGK